jgi:hypothetical protein
VGLPPLSAAQTAQQQQQLLARLFLAQQQAQQAAMAAATRGIAPPAALVQETVHAALIRMNPSTLKGMIYTMLVQAGAKVSRQGGAELEVEPEQACWHCTCPGGGIM